MTGQPRPGSPSDQAPRAAAIDRNGTLILIRSTLIALSQANETGNYTVLRDLGAPTFRDSNTAARLSEIFTTQRAQKIDLSGVAVLDPQLTVLPQIEASGLMRIAGFFPSVPNQLNFKLLYSPVEGRWRLFGVAVNLGTSSPVAPGAAQLPTPAAIGQPELGKPDPKAQPNGSPPASPNHKRVAPRE